MRPDEARIARFERDGVLSFPGLPDGAEIAATRDALADVLTMDRPEIPREKRSSGVRRAFAPHAIRYNRVDDPPSAFARPDREAHGDFGPVEALDGPGLARAGGRRGGSGGTGR